MEFIGVLTIKVSILGIISNLTSRHFFPVSPTTGFFFGRVTFLFIYLS